MTLSVIAPKYISGMGFSGWERSEDFLTGEFFGLLRYLPAHAGVLPVLARATTKDGLVFGAWLGERTTVGRAEIKLWSEFDGGIPDVLIHLEGNDGSAIADVLVEVKLYSGQSERQDDPRHQLARYMTAFASESALGHASARSLVYLTLDRSLPTVELTTALKHAGIGREKVELFWHGWQDVAAALHDLANSGVSSTLAKHEATALEDLRGILRARGIRIDAELEHFPLADIEPLRDLGPWLDSWSLVSGRS